MSKAAKQHTSHFDFATVVGPFLAIFAIAFTVSLENETPISLLNLPALVLVVGGTLGATMVAYPLKTFIRLPVIIWQAFKVENNDPKVHIKLMVRLADKVRKSGLLGLEEDIPKIDDLFTRNAMTLLIDGFPAEDFLSVLVNDNEMTVQRHYVYIKMLDVMASFAPAMGMMGTVVGLVGVMGNLTDPSQLGPSVAVAFLTTLYGALLSNLVFIPLANKLKYKDEEEMFVRELIMEGLLAVQES
ncbi:MAG: motility protein A, partial [Methylococcaceae bacterium]|nr:motility protein A [Methylococcaceae bacterium]